MSENIIQFPEGRGNQPDEDCVMRDDQFLQMFLYGYQYVMEDGETWSFNLWAYSIEDAEARLKAIKETLAFRGQIMTVMPT